MNPLLIGGLLGGGLGLLRNMDQKERYEDEQALNSIKARYSPWTGIHPTNPQAPDMFGNIMSGAMGGLLQGQALAGYFPPEKAAEAAAVNGLRPESNMLYGDLYAGQNFNRGTAIPGAPALPMSPYQQIQMQGGGTPYMYA